MPSNAIMGTGIKLKVGDGGSPSETFDDLGELRSLKPGNMTRDLRDVTNHGSTGGWREFLNGLKDGGVVTGQVNYVPTDGTQNASTGLIADLVSGVRRNFRIVFPDVGATTWSFAGIVTKFEPDEVTVESELTASFEIKITGQPTLA